MNIPDGTLLQGGKYKIVRHISSGGFGNTYEALDVNLDKRVAIKEFFVKDFCSRESDTTLVTIASTAKKPLIEHLKKKFIEEARAIAKMEHENIVKVQALFEENGTAYYVMDYIEGESLSALLKRRGSLSENEALPIILKVADALGYMHKQNRFHLDVKPSSIIIYKDGSVVLLCNISSRLYDVVVAQNDYGDILNISDCYKAIEQHCNNPTLYNAATDIYAIGTILYRMVTGCNPPLAIEETSLTFTDEISKKVRFCISKSMQSIRRNRFQSIEEFVCFLKGMPAELYDETILKDECSHVASEKNSNRMEIGKKLCLKITIFLSFVISIILAYLICTKMF